ncbi:MAG: ribosome biogenesis GTPase Der [Candidatus Babeliales bacterium]
MNTYPLVVLVGRTNVGKSTLFNRLSVDAKSLTLDYHGVTRDVIKDVISWNDRTFELCDTGGISLRKTQDPILAQVRERALALLEKATVILFVVDAKAGVVTEDQELARMLRKQGNKVILVVNKIDNKQSQEHLFEFERLGFTHQVQLSAQHGSGTADLLELLTAMVPVTKQQDESELMCKVVLLGKPNVGKSSLMNLLLKQERSIVADIPGTTREAISERITFNRADIELTDTAGVRRKRGVTEELETMMVKSSLRAVEDANVILLLVDAAEGKLSDQELKLAFYAFEHHKALIILFNKQDLATDFSKGDMERSLDEYEFLMKKVACLDISCKTGKNVGKVMPLVETVWKRYTQQLENDDLTMLFKDALVHKPLYHQSHVLALRAAKQVATGPITILLIVNEPKWFGPTQLGFFENMMRKHYDLVGVPVRFFCRKTG